MTAIRTLAIDYSDMTDVELASRCAGGDAQAVRHLVSINNQRLFRAAWSVLRNRHEAEDALQACYAKALAAIGTFEGRSSLTTWLTRIAINEAIARRRSQERRRKHIEAKGAQVLETYREQLAKGSQAPSPEAEAAREQLRSILEQAIGGLPESFRTVFVLREIEDASVEDTALALGIPIGTVKTRLMRARLKLQQRLAPEVKSALCGTFPFAGADCARLTEQVVRNFIASRERGNQALIIRSASRDERKYPKSTTF
jgi:RNA polymerase sigma-70 factor (ECF subfamily)